ncbi:MAG: SLC13 family permease [Alphaproteobacteria bacterium]
MKLKPAQVVAAVVIAAAVALVLFPPADMSPQVARAGGLSVAVIALLATGVVPEFVAALIFFVIAVLFAVAPTETVFSGFTASAFWLVFGGLLIGTGVRETGLARRLAGAIAGRVGGNYPAVIFGVSGLGLALGFLMPSTLSRILIMLPIVLAMADRLGLPHGRQGRVGMVLASSFVTMIPCFTILPAAVPAMVLSGASETLYGYTPTYGEWLLLHFPVLGLPKAIIIAAAVIWLFPDRIDPDGEPPSPAPPASGRERLMALMLAGALALWVTDFLHGISPAWVALTVGTICVLPFVAIVPAKSFNENVNLGPLVYLAGMLGIGAVIAETGVGTYVAEHALAVLRLEPGAPLRTFVSISGLSAILAMLTTQPGVSAVLTPLAGTLAEAADLSIPQVLMMTVVGHSTVVLPYQTPPLIVAMQVAQVPIAAGNKLCLTVFAATVVILLPLDYLWWLALGWIG